MKHRKRQGVLLGLLAALSLLAFSASAQALTPNFVYKNKAGTEVFLLAKITAKQLGRGTLSIPGLNSEVNCEKFSISGGAIETATDAVGTLTYEECTALELKAPLGELANCEIVTPEHETTGGLPHNITATALILPAELKNGEPALLAEGIVSKIVTKKEVGCLLPALTTIKGEVCLKIDSNDTVLPELLASEAIQGECRARPTLEALTELSGPEKEIIEREALKPPTAFLDELLFGAQKSFITGTAAVSFPAGEHEGFKLAVFLK
jgi:hypothetical protein